MALDIAEWVSTEQILSKGQADPPYFKKVMEAGMDLASKPDASKTMLTIGGQTIPVSAISFESPTFDGETNSITYKMKFDMSVVMTPELLSNLVLSMTPAAQPKLTPEQEEAASADRAKRRVGTLMFVNEVRNDLGLPPLDGLIGGTRQSNVHCAIANSIKEGLSTDYAVSVNHEGTNIHKRDGFLSSTLVRHYNHDADINKFISDFDLALYPDLVVPPKPTTATDFAKTYNFAKAYMGGFEQQFDFPKSGTYKVAQPGPLFQPMKKGWLDTSGI